MGVLTGRQGTLYLGEQELLPLAGWRLEVRAATVGYASNATGGALRRVIEATDCAGTLRCHLAAGGHVRVQPGLRAQARFHVDAGGDNYYAAAIVIERIALRVSVADAAVLELVARFVGDGPLTPQGILASE